MEAMDFPGLYVHWIKQCATSSRLSVVIDGSLHGYFPRKRGLRQGDPLSPYLFLLVMQAFTALLEYRVDTEAFTYHPRCSSSSLVLSLQMICLFFVVLLLNLSTLWIEL